MGFQRMFWVAAPAALVVGGIVVLESRQTHDVVTEVRGRLAELDVCCETAQEFQAYTPPSAEGAFVKLTRLGDEQTAWAGFTLTEPLDVRIYAIGEGSGNQMYDYGWVLDADTRRAVWRMDYHETQPAGGARKNRLVDRVVTLTPGNYLAYYRTDGSHSWSDWNADPPMDRDGWGMTVFAADGAVEPPAVRAYEPTADPAIIAQLTGIGDGEHARRAFALDRDTAVRVYALGEGVGSRMYDYAWIERVGTRAIVWEMSYGLTEHAGGATKNRRFDGTITLTAGDYLLHFRSDDSHSAEEWNAAPPSDPFGWGVTIYSATPAPPAPPSP